MPEHPENLITALSAGAQRTEDDLLASVYQDLKIVARSRLRQHKSGMMLNTTALVHETYLKMAGEDGEIEGYSNRRHFFATAAMAMRQILTDQARKRLTRKRGGNQRNLTLDEQAVASTDIPEEMLALDAGLSQLAQLSPKLADLVQLKYFSGLGLDEIAEIQGVSKRTVSRQWDKARAYLHAHIEM